MQHVRGMVTPCRPGASERTVYLTRDECEEAARALRRGDVPLLAPASVPEAQAVPCGRVTDAWLDEGGNVWISAELTAAAAVREAGFAAAIDMTMEPGRVYDKHLVSVYVTTDYDIPACKLQFT